MATVLAVATPRTPHAAAAAVLRAATGTTAVTAAAAGGGTTPGPPRSTTTSTTVAPARCDPVPPVALGFVGTVRRSDETVVRLRIDEVRTGPPVGGTEVDVTYVRDARFLKAGRRYLVAAALDPDTGLYLSKVRELRGTDPRCAALDPIVTRQANGSVIDTGIFAGMKGTRGKVVRAFLLPLAAVVGGLAALVAAKWLVILLSRLVRRLVRGAAAGR